MNEEQLVKKFYSAKIALSNTLKKHVPSESIDILEKWRRAQYNSDPAVTLGHLETNESIIVGSNSSFSFMYRVCVLNKNVPSESEHFITIYLIIYADPVNILDVDNRVYPNSIKSSLYIRWPCTSFLSFGDLLLFVLRF